LASAEKTCPRTAALRDKGKGDGRNPASGGLHAGAGATGGSLPVNLPVLDENYRIADAVLYEMGARVG